MTDVQLFGLDPGWHHLSSVFLHILTSLLLLRLLWRATGMAWPSALVAALFAVHPMHVESVAWVAERKDVLSALFWVLTCSAYVTYVRRPSLVRYALVALSLVLALMSKPMAVTLPFALLLMDVWPLGRDGGRRAIRAAARDAWPLVSEKLPLIALAAASAVVTFLVQRKAGAVQSIDAFPIAMRLANVPVAYAKYVLLTIVPVGARAALSVSGVHSVVDGAASTACLAGDQRGGVSVAPDDAVSRDGLVLVSGHAPSVIGLIQVGSQPYADRYTYVPAIGLFIMLAWAPNG